MAIGTCGEETHGVAQVRVVYEAAEQLKASDSSRVLRDRTRKHHHYQTIHRRE
jgi:hypothetical protein